MEENGDEKEDACIICLCELPQDPEKLSEADASKNNEHDELSLRRIRSKSPARETELLANLRPCNHHLHDECLKQWAQRSNSCPLCRERFNVVEVSAYVDGPILDSYAVEDKVQVVELNPTFSIDDDSLDTDICMVCESDCDHDHLMMCHGCDNTCHVFCAGLEEAPSAGWWCVDCRDGSYSRNRGRASRRSRPMTVVERGRRERARRDRFEEIRYNRLREGVYAATGLDIDFPYHHRDADHDLEAERAHYRERMHTDMDIWQRRLEIARMQGAGRMFERTTRRLLHRPEEITREEDHAWKALDQAYGVTMQGGKRKRTSESPTPAPDGEARKFKRPRTFRQGKNEGRSNAGESSKSHLSPADRSRAAKAPEDERNPSGNFLQTLLEEVQGPAISSGRSTETNNDLFVATSINGRDISFSPQAFSPASPTSSSYATPNSMTPPASPTNLPCSPRAGGTPSVMRLPRPAYVYSPAVNDEEDRRSRSRQRRTPSHSPTASPTPVTAEMKSEVQKMVSGALKPYYKDGQVSTDEYTCINRDISRMLYNMVGEAGGLGGADAKGKWQTKAVEEVQQAVKQAKAIRAESDAEKNKAYMGSL